jgi:hypothetical protein
MNLFLVIQGFDLSGTSKPHLRDFPLPDDTTSLAFRTKSPVRSSEWVAGQRGFYSFLYISFHQVLQIQILYQEAVIGINEYHRSLILQRCI